MARKSNNLADGLFDLFSKAPWWVGVSAAVVFWICAMILCGKVPKESPNAMFNTLGRIFLYALAFVSLAAAAYSAVQQLLRHRLLDRQEDLQSIKDLSWREFEQLVGEAYHRQGYDVEETGGGGTDGGIDLVLRGNNETILVQCKQWRVQQVGVDKVRELYGVMIAEGANRAILVTCGHFTNDAKSFKVGKPLTLVDGPALALLVHDVRTQSACPAPPTVQPPNRPPVQPPDRAPVPQPTCPLCGSPMVIRTAKRGANAGGQFYGCTRFKTGCTGTLSA
jgi:restriction system protein